MTKRDYRVVARVEHNEHMASRKKRPLTLYDVYEVSFEDGSQEVGGAVGKGLFGNHTTVKSLARTAEDVDDAFLHPVLWHDPDLDALVPFSHYMGLLSQYDRLLGCLLGCALGDAIGAPVEAKSKLTCQAYAEDCVLKNDYEGIQRDEHPFGQVTDDTQCMRIIAQSFDDEGLFSGLDFAEGLANWHMGPGLVGYGENTFLAIEDYLTSGKPWYECGRPHPACGNGAAMRAAILGVMDNRYGAIDSFLSLVEQSCLATHAAPEAILGAQIMAGLARELTKVEEDSFDARRILNRVLVTLHPHYGHLDMFHDWLRLSNIFGLPYPKDRKKRYASKLAFDLQPSGSHWGTGLSPYVRPSVLWAVYAFLAHPDDFTKSIATAIECGGDVDTTAAMTGALHGVYNGTANLDRGLLAQLHDRGTWELPAYIELARDLIRKLNYTLQPQ